jgi:hypothetical protein
MQMPCHAIPGKLAGIGGSSEALATALLRSQQLINKNRLAEPKKHGFSSQKAGLQFAMNDATQIGQVA